MTDFYFTVGQAVQSAARRGCTVQHSDDRYIAIGSVGTFTLTTDSLGRSYYWKGQTT